MLDIASRNARYRFLKIYNEGYSAGKSNVSIDSNPYEKEDARHEHWLCGYTRWELWREAYQKGQQQRNINHEQSY